MSIMFELQRAIGRWVPVALLEFEDPRVDFGLRRLYSTPMILQIFR